MAILCTAHCQSNTNSLSASASAQQQVANSQSARRARVAESVELLGMALELGTTSGCSPDFPLFLSSSQRSATPPPLDEISVYCCSVTDDSSTFSTASFDDERVHNSSPASPRLIFQCYWDKHGRQPPSLPSLDSSFSDDSTCSTDFKHSFEAERPNTIHCRRRRRIFSDVGCFSQAQTSSSSSSSSAPVPEDVQSLVSSLRLRERIVRKAHSVPGLISQPGASCLRPSAKRSIPQRRHSDSSVTFSDHVDVVYFQRPKENWAADGWSKFFAF